MIQNISSNYHIKHEVSLLYKLFLMLFEIGFGLQLNIVGMISVSELFLTVYFVYYIFFIRYKIDKDLGLLTKLYGILLIVQIISESVNGNSLGNAARGLAITVFSYFHLLFLFIVFKKDRKLIIWLLLGMIIRPIIFPGSITGDTGDALSGGNSTYLKFVVAPFISNILLIWATVTKSRLSGALFIILGLVFVVAGARSAGLFCVLTGVFSLIILKKRIIAPKKMLGYISIAMILGYGWYCIYVNQVLSGNITAGNNEQLLRVKNPYNPLMLLATGRSETVAGAVAFSDRPLFGWGSWKKDSECNFKYHYIVQELHDISAKDNYVISDFDVIPTHSVIIGYGTFNGVFALILILYIFNFIVIRGYQSLEKPDRYIYVLVFFLLQFIWNSIFSPLSHFRQTLPLYMAFILVSYLITNNTKSIVSQQVQIR